MSERIEAWAVTYEDDSGDCCDDYLCYRSQYLAEVAAMARDLKNPSIVHLVPATELEELRAAVRWLYETWGDHYVPHRDTLRELYDDGDTMATAILKCWEEE